MEVSALCAGGSTMGTHSRNLNYLAFSMKMLRMRMFQESGVRAAVETLFTFHGSYIWPHLQSSLLLQHPPPRNEYSKSPTLIVQQNLLR